VITFIVLLTLTYCLIFNDRVIIMKTCGICVNGKNLKDKNIKD